ITAEKFLMNINKSLEYIVDQKVKENLQKDKLLVKQSKLASMGEMIDAIAHQWKNPLATVDLIAQKIKNKIKNKKLDTKKLSEDMDDILMKTKHLVETINEFRNFFRPHTFVEKVNIKSMIDSTLVLLNDELRSHRIKARVHGNMELCVFVNQNEFKHVLINLIQNSKDAFEENKIKDKEIVFEIIKQKETIKLDVTDNAGGIDDETIKKIFKPHFTTKENGKGTGIGLYLTQQIIEKNHAMMEVESIGSNTKFSLIFAIK
ncbi:MAG: HAMP domain-containing sensor histidine kinase, partial [Sphaerochaetaceae bacterium]|nr:HAMP domain-containing sensor histidine kinase [Sphaerochaetaceae bacterium]